MSDTPKEMSAAELAEAGWRAADERKAEMELAQIRRYEYKVETFVCTTHSGHSSYTSEGFQAWLNERGADGWLLSGYECDDESFYYWCVFSRVIGQTT